MEFNHMSTYTHNAHIQAYPPPLEICAPMEMSQECSPGHQWDLQHVYAVLQVESVNNRPD
jgi:hypothetical protein